MVARGACWNYTSSRWCRKPHFLWRTCIRHILRLAYHSSTCASAAPVPTTESPPHGLSQVCRGLGHIAGPSFPLHIRRQGRRRRVHLDIIQRNKAGGWIELQHLLIRHHGEEEPAAARKECAEKAANIATPGRYQSPRHC